LKRASSWSRIHLYTIWGLIIWRRGARSSADKPNGK